MPCCVSNETTAGRLVSRRRVHSPINFDGFLPVTVTQSSERTASPRRSVCRFFQFLPRNCPRFRIDSHSRNSYREVSTLMTDLITDIWAGLKDAGMPEVMLYLADGSASRCHWDETACWWARSGWPCSLTRNARSCGLCRFTSARESASPVQRGLIRQATARLCSVSSMSDWLRKRSPSNRSCDW